MCQLSPWACYYSTITRDTADAESLLRLRVAWKAKRIIDAGRVLFLRRNCGMENARLLHYVDARISPENVMLLA